MNLGNKQLVVLGGGESGVGAAILGKKMGAKVFLSDSDKIKDKYKTKLKEHTIQFEECGHTLSTLSKADLIVKSPGIDPKSKTIIQLKKVRIPIIGELEFTCHFTHSFLICITGSNGKTTTSNLMYQTLSVSNYDVALAGNMGKSFAEKVALEDSKYYVVEVSSFMLDDIETKFKPNIAIMLNITPDHLNRYENSFEKYVQSKFKILKNMTLDDLFIYNSDDKNITEYLDKNKFDVTMYSFSLQNKNETKMYMNDDRQLILKY